MTKEKEPTKEEVGKSSKLNIFKKEKEYNVKVDLEKLVGGLVNYLSNDGWSVQSGNIENGKIIQATKGGILREIFAADRALTVIFTKISPTQLKTEIGIGKWIENIGTVVIEAAILSTIFLVIDIPEILWNYHIENTIMKKIDDLVEQQNPWNFIKR